MGEISTTRTAAPTTTMTSATSTTSFVHHDVRARVQTHHLGGRHGVGVLLVEELEAAPEPRRLLDEVLVLGDLQALRAEAVHVEHVGQPVALLERLLRDHVV